MGRLGLFLSIGWSMHCHGHQRLCLMGGVGDSCEFEGHVSMIEKYESVSENG
jgi:hypothetical protein